MLDYLVIPESARRPGESATSVLAFAVPRTHVESLLERLDGAGLAVDRIERATTLQIRYIRRRWAGLRSFVADRAPVIGMDPDLPGFFWLAGQGGFGIMTSPAASRASTSLIVRGSLPPDLEKLGLTREQLSPRREGLAGSASAVPVSRS